MISFIIRLGVAFLFIAMIVTWYYIPDSFFLEYSDANTQEMIKRDQAVIAQTKKETQEKSVQEQSSTNEIQDSVKQSVPFTVQAPHAQWEDPKYQDACEEASMVMASEWIKGTKYISKNDAENMIEEIFAKEAEIFGQVVDTSVADTARFFEQYYGHTAQVVENITMEQMYSILSQEHIIIAPTNGKMLNNPNFTNGGPERHMLVVIGYDRDNREFVTNDPGTRVGRGYKYKDTTLYNAIRDYETGNKKEIVGSNKKVIVIKK